MQKAANEQTEKELTAFTLRICLELRSLPKQHSICLRGERGRTISDWPKISTVWAFYSWRFCSEPSSTTPTKSHWQDSRLGATLKIPSRLSWKRSHCIMLIPRYWRPSLRWSTQTLKRDRACPQW